MNGTRRSRTAVLIGATLWIAIIGASTVQACSIPVFRYALERWPADLFEVDVFYHDQLSADERALVARLEDQAIVNGGRVNWEVVLCRWEETLAADLVTVRDGLGTIDQPTVVLRRPGGRRGSPIVWQGALRDITSDLWSSTSRTNLVNRLTAGDAIVWLVFRGQDAQQAAQEAAMLRAEFPRLTEEITLPMGVGLPGSELLSTVPLAVHFSVLEVDTREAAEAHFRRQILSGHTASIADDQTLIVPVFGRGRAFSVFTTDSLDADAIAETTRFLCGACSCQVKQGNPGFDLLLDVDWEQRLWGQGDAPEEISSPSKAAEMTDQLEQPTLIAIPPGTSAPAKPATASKSTVEPEHSPRFFWFTGGLAACVLFLMLVRRR